MTSPGDVPYKGDGGAGGQATGDGGGGKDLSNENRGQGDF